MAVSTGDTVTIEYGRAQLREMLGRDPETGMELRTEEGLSGRVADVGDDRVSVDFNHELAGETPVFDVEILEVD